VARDKLVPKPPESDKRTPRTRFTETASKVFSMQKSEVDEREKQWRDRKNAKRDPLKSP
jgi:hypothetical protein